MEEKKKVSEAQKRATAKFEKNAYFKVLVRFPKDKEDLIRRAAGDSLNGFIVNTILEAATAAADAGNEKTEG